MNRNRVEKTSSKKWRGSRRRIISAAIYALTCFTGCSVAWVSGVLGAEAFVGGAWLAAVPCLVEIPATPFLIFITFIVRQSVRQDNITCFTHGCSVGWVSGVLGAEAFVGGAWLAAVPCLVAIPATPFFVFIAYVKGRKAGAFWIAVCFFISWSLITWGGYRGVWIGRMVAGAGGGGALVLAPIYCAELPPSAKGLATSSVLACSLGILFAYILGGFLSSPHSVSVAMLLPPTFLIMALLWIPETPSYLISVGRVQEAAKVMCWLAGSDFREDLTDVIEQQEVSIRTSDYYEPERDRINRLDSETFQPMLRRNTSSALESVSAKSDDCALSLKFIGNRQVRRGLLHCCILLTVSAGTGAGAVNSYAAGLLRDSVWSADSSSVHLFNSTAFNFTIYHGNFPRRLFETAEAGSMICGTALVLGAAVATVTVDKFGRKVLLVSSCSGVACCLAVLGVYCDPALRMNSWYFNSNQDLKIKHENQLSIQSAKPNLNFTNEISKENFTLKKEEPIEYIFGKNYTIDNKTEIKVLNTENAQEIKDYRTTQNFTERDLNISKDDKTKNVILMKDIASLPVILLSAALFFYNMGLGSVPYVLISELFDRNKRDVASSIILPWMWFTNFFVLRYYNTIAISIGLHLTFYISASFSLIGSIYVCLGIPETKGKSRKEIDAVLLQKS